MIDYFTVGGYVNATEKPSQTLFDRKRKVHFREYMQKGVFKDALKRSKNLPLLHEHRPNEVLATVQNKTLSVIENDIGLKFIAQISNKEEQLYRDIKSNKYGCSFGMVVLEDKWEKQPSGIYHRVITKIELIEVTLTKNPAYKGSEAEIRSKDNQDVAYRFIDVKLEENTIATNNDWKWQLDLKRKRLNLL